MTGQDDDLEAALQVAWDPETATVYADLLTSRGDPRGELIAIDLLLAQQPAPELHVRKRELIEAWIPGSAIDAWPVLPCNVRFGLLRGYGAATSSKHQMRGYLALLFDAVGDCVGDLTLAGNGDDLAEAIAAIAARRLPWLSTLTINRSASTPHPIPKPTWQRLVDATPNLKELTLRGTSVVLSPIHPAITTLRLDGAAIAVGEAPVPSVTRLDLVLHDPNRRPVSPTAARSLAPLVNPRTFPALRVLDLSRNEPMKYSTPSERIGIAEFLDDVERLDRVERVRVPSIADADAAAPLVAILARHPALEIEVARMYATLEGIAHPRLHVPPPRAWPASAHDRDVLSIGWPPQGWSEDITVSSLIDDLEWQFDAMPASAQHAWVALWDLLDRLPPTANSNDVIEPFPAATLLHGLEALDGNDRCDRVATRLLKAAPRSGATVHISRALGWPNGRPKLHY